MRLAIVASLIFFAVRTAAADIITFENAITQVGGACDPLEIDLSVPFTLTGSIQFPIVPKEVGEEFGWGGPIPHAFVIGGVDVTDRMRPLAGAFGGDWRAGSAYFGATFQGGHYIQWIFSEGTLTTFPPELNIETGEFHLSIQAFAEESPGGVLVDCQLSGQPTSLHFTQTGDANFDGVFNTSDLIQVFQAGEYENDIVTDSTWETGDWTGDSEFDSQDLTVALQRGTFGGTASALPVPVPEPECLFLLALGIMFFKSQSNRRCQ